MLTGARINNVTNMSHRSHNRSHLSNSTFKPYVTHHTCHALSFKKTLGT